MSPQGIVSLLNIFVKRDSLRELDLEGTVFLLLT